MPYHVLAEYLMRDHLATLLDDFRRYGRQTAVVRFQGIRRRVTTYGEIARLAGRFAALLVRRGIGPGDRVLLWAENSAEWIAAFHGCLLRGVLVVPLDAYGSAEFAARVAADVAPKLAIGDALLLDRLSPGLPRLAFEEWQSALPAEESEPAAGLSRQTPLQILFTSGTTGDPKGVVLTHGNVLASIEPIEIGAQPYLRYERLVHPLRFLHTLPLSHVFGQTMGLWIPPIFGAEVHFESRLVAPRLIETIRRERISVLAAVPRVIGLLKTHLESTRPGLTDRLAASQGIRAWQRWWRFREVHAAFGFKFWALISGGGALASPLEQFWNALGFVVVQGYGMTETSALITLNHPFHVARGSIGKPLPGREVKLGPDGEVLVRGAMISAATWSGGALQPRGEEWLSTGDLAETAPDGGLRFVGRKSEVIVTAAGVNVHPEDLEAAVEQQSGVLGCAVVPMETSSGPEPCAVVAFRGDRQQAARAVERANETLADFQRIRRWVLWPEPDLPRTSTGKVRRKPVAAWLASNRALSPPNPEDGTGAERNSAASAADWLLNLISGITGEAPSGGGDDLRLGEDLQLDSLGRVQLAAALEERLGIGLDAEIFGRTRTLGELRALIAGQRVPAKAPPTAAPALEESGRNGAAWGPGEASAPFASGAMGPPAAFSAPGKGLESDPGAGKYLYPHWPWLAPVAWLRAAFLEAVMRPLVWLLAHPRVTAPELPISGQPLLIVANHVTAFDGPLVQYALPGRLRRRMAAAMAGDMLEEFRHFRNPERPAGRRGFYLPGPLAYLLLTALFNVFPLPRQKNFQRSFAHAGEAMDRGYSVLVFPEGTRSADGRLARFRGGIGLLARQSGVPVLPVALRGLGRLKTQGRGWFRSGTMEVRVGQPIRFAPQETEIAITARLHREVAQLLGMQEPETAGNHEPPALRPIDPDL